jgi:hypothetical protein
LSGKKVIVTGGDSVSIITQLFSLSGHRQVFFAREGAGVTIFHLPQEKEE